MSPSVSATRVAALLADQPLARPVYQSLAAGLRRLIADGRLASGARLPSERGLAPALGVSRTTVTHAYAALRDTGYLTSRVGAGWQVRLPPSRTRAARGGLFPVDSMPGVIDLTCAATRASAGVAEAYEAAVGLLPEHLAGTGYLTKGLPELRELIAARYAARGLPTQADQVIITSGAVAGIQVVAAALLNPGDRVVTETPTYPNSLAAIRRTAARVVGVPLAPHGWDLEALAAAARSARPTMALLIPDFHNPTGLLMGDEDRTRTAGALSGVRTVVDETICELALDDIPMPLPYAAHDHTAITVGSASKSHWGGLRLGWIRAPRDLIDPLVNARVSIDLGAPVLEQLVLATLLRGHLGLAPERRNALRHARDTLAGALVRTAPGLTFTPPAGGLSLWLELDRPEATEVAEAAENEGLLISAGPAFAVAGGFDRWLRMPFVDSPEDLVEAATRLGRAVEAVASGRHRSLSLTTGSSRRRGQSPRPLIA